MQPGSTTASPSPRGSSFSNGSVSSHTSYAPTVNGQNPSPKTPSPEQVPQRLGALPSLSYRGAAQPVHVQSQLPPSGYHAHAQAYTYATGNYATMNQMQPYSDVHPSQHMSSAAPLPPVSAAPASLSHYTYPPQPSVLSGPQYGYNNNGYQQQYAPNGVPNQLAVSSSMSNAMVPSAIQLPAMSSAGSNPPVPNPGQPYGGQNQPFDHTGQTAPPGMKPRVTATLWEDEGSLCFQVEAKTVCVARREDNHMINGTKLLNVAGMTRGRRDGILKSEKNRHVVKIGPMHLKGVWIPFERALEFANKEKITDLLYPLFVHDIGSLLYHPTNNQSRASGNALLDRRRPDPMQTQRYLPPAGSQPPPLHHHHTMSNPVAGGMSQAPHAIQPHPSAGRPGLERAHTFPTPPGSATGLMGMPSQGHANDWNGPGYQNMPGSQPLQIDTGLSNTRSVPSTPASTPPGTMQPGMSYSTAQGYDGSRSMYSGPPSQAAQYSTQIPSYRQDSGYPKSEMAPPARSNDQGDVKPSDGMLQQHSNEPGTHATGEDAADHENDAGEYTHYSASNNATRGSYYGSSTAPGSIHGDHGHVSPEMRGSPHQNGSGRQTPRTTATSQTQWGSGYPTQRQPASEYLNNVMSDPRGTATNGNSASDYQPQSHYNTQSYAPPNGVQSSAKRSRDPDDEEAGRGDSAHGEEPETMKRRKTMENGVVSGNNTYRGPTAGLQRPRPTVAARPSR